MLYTDEWAGVLARQSIKVPAPAPRRRPGLSLGGVRLKEGACGGGAAGDGLPRRPHIHGAHPPNPPTPPHPVPLGRRVTSREASPPRRARASRGVGLSASPRAALLLPAAERRRESVVSPPFFPNIGATLAGPY